MMTVEIIDRLRHQFHARCGKNPRFIILGEIAWGQVCTEVTQKFMMAKAPGDECYSLMLEKPKTLLGLDVVLVHGDSVEFGW